MAQHTKEHVKESPKRLLALDIMRGITIAGMILVNNPGSWSNIYAPLEHAEWHGLTPTDLVFPFFMFIMGVSTYFSLRKYDFRLSGDCLRKILVRTVVIFGIGIAIAWFGKFLRALARPADDKGNIDSVCAQGVNVRPGDEARAPDGGSLHEKSSRFFLSFYTVFRMISMACSTYARSGPAA